MPKFLKSVAKMLYYPIATVTLFSVCFLIAVPLVVYQAWRWIELWAVYDGSQEDREKAEWKGWL